MNARPCRGRSQRALIATLVSLTALTGPVWAVPAAAAPAVTPSVTSAPPVSLTAPPAALPSRLPILDRQAHEQFAPLRLEEAWRYATGAGVLVAVLTPVWTLTIRLGGAGAAGHRLCRRIH